MKVVAKKKFYLGMESRVSKMGNQIISEVSDEALLKRFVSETNKLAFTEVYNRHFATLSKYVGWLANDMEIGKDIAQSIFIKIYDQPDVFDLNKKFKTWLYVAAKNSWANEWRNNANRNRLLNDCIEDPPEASGSSGSSEQDVQMKQVNQALDRLSDDHKSVFLLKYSTNLTIKEISEISNCSEGTVKSRLFYAIKKLRDIIGIQKQL